MNIQNTALKPSLTEFPLNIHPDVNKCQDKNPGLNVSTFYLGTAGSVTSMHCEDGFLDSANLLLYGPNNGYKVWIILLLMSI